MQIRPVPPDKSRYLDLLLLADEQEDGIDEYLARGDVFGLFDDDLRSICVVTREADGSYELKSIATRPAHQRKGYGTALVRHVLEHYRGRGPVLYVGTGDVPRMRSFYERCGFVYSHRVPDFFLDHCDHPIFEDGTQLIDMVYFVQSLGEPTPPDRA